MIDDVEICHGSPDDEDEYIFEPVDAIEALRGTQREVCFFGHTHVAIGYWMSADDLRHASCPSRRRHVHRAASPERRYMINPGSVGQPRDGDPRAAYRDLRLGHPDRAGSAAWPTTSPPRRRKIVKARTARGAGAAAGAWGRMAIAAALSLGL